jgi:tetratricopeptide (TPR) repeat protein
MRFRDPFVMFMLVASCRSHPPSQVEGAPASSARPAASEVSAATPKDAAATIAPVSPEAWKRYGAAMKRGRGATAHKNYPEAIQAFDDAVSAAPRDARARAERGYVKYLAGDNVGAAADLDAAVDLVPATDKKLAAQIYFNEGLAAEKAGADAVAGSYYRQSYELNPTNAAKAKMGTCAVVVASFHTDIVADRPLALALIKSKNPGVTIHEDVGDNLLGVGDSGEDAFAILPVVPGFAVVDTDVSVAMGAKGPAGTVTLNQAGNEWVVTGQANVPSAADCNDEGCSPMARVQGGTHDVFYVDAKTGAALWHASYDFAFDGRVDLAVENGALHVTGAGCDSTSPRPSP